MAEFYDPSALFAGIPLYNEHGRDYGHDQVAKYLLVARDGVDARVPRHGGGQTVNHQQGYDATAMARYRTGLESDSSRLAEIRDMLDAERLWGLNLKEVNSATYCERSAMYRALLWAETRLARNQRGDSDLLREIESLSLHWWRGHRFVRHLFRASNGLVYGPGIRVKWGRGDMEFQHLTTHYAHGGVTDSDVLRMIREDEAGSPERMTFRRDEQVAVRFYRSPAGQELFRLTANEIKPRLSTAVFVQRGRDESYAAYMPQVTVIPESRGMPPHVLWYIQVDGEGRIVESEYESERRVPPKEIMRAPTDRDLDWTIQLGPSTVLAEVQPVSEVDTATPPDLPPPIDNPKDDNPPDLTDPLPRWRVQRWLQDRGVPVPVAAPLAEIVWQAQRLERGEDRAEERLTQAVRELREV